jgi:hypothetical protein
MTIKTFFPQGLEPFTRGKIDERIEVIRIFKENCEADGSHGVVNLTLAAAVDAFYTKILAARAAATNKNHSNEKLKLPDGINFISLFKMEGKEVWTIGHSTRSIEEFLGILQSFSITLLADIRSYPGSRRYPHFNKEALENSLGNSDIQYIHMAELGGRRRPRPDSLNTEWRNESFRGYADYMETPDFVKGIKRLEEIASTVRTAYMCSEALWWKCHRSMVSDYMKWKGWTVWHIMAAEKANEHRYTKPAQIIDGELKYYSLFSES